MRGGAQGRAGQVEIERRPWSRFWDTDVEWMRKGVNSGLIKPTTERGRRVSGGEFEESSIAPAVHSFSVAGHPAPPLTPPYAFNASG